ncbi:MAG: response regulator transcription factor [Bacteroidia bacterium]|nr:response regulator transcription factor [Bacteroidia bacterium]MCZ2247582.1 response regulator transcription factor [Bacteroidia bacterium]
MNILVIEDDPTLNNNIKEALISEGYNVEGVYDGLLAERLLKKNVYDCLVVDINLPGKSGFDLCSDFREFNKTTPVIMLTAFSDIEDKVKGYACGADDYLTKPFYMRELLLRISSLIKRVDKGANDAINKILSVDSIVIDETQKSVKRNGENIALTPREYQILLKLVKNKGEIISKNDLIKEIWGNIVDANTNTIEVYINFLRNKIDKPFGKNNIKTKVGYGYYFE